MSLNRKKSLLWELSMHGRSESSYLFGTIHLQEKSLFFRIPDVQNCIDRTDAFMAEFPLDEISAGEMDFYNLPGGQNWQDYMSARQYKKLEKSFLKFFSINIHAFNQLLPLVMEQVLLDTMIKDHSGQSMDFVLWYFAKSRGKTLLGAESKVSQLEILEKFPRDIQFKNLKKIAQNPASYKEKIRKAKQAYFGEDLRKLAKQSIKSLGKMKSVLVYDRNIKITQAILNTMKQQTLTCAIGAGHLNGQKGVLSLLKQNGIILKPVD
jgi:uncharacterized protein YbaP (TraB family)